MEEAQASSVRRERERERVTSIGQASLQDRSVLSTRTHPSNMAAHRPPHPTSGPLLYTPSSKRAPGSGIQAPGPGLQQPPARQGAGQRAAAATGHSQHSLSLSTPRPGQASDFNARMTETHHGVLRLRLRHGPETKRRNQYSTTLEVIAIVRLVRIVLCRRMYETRFKNRSQNIILGFLW